MVSRCLSATGVRFSVILRPARDRLSSRSAHRPTAGRTSTGFPCSARMSNDRGGRPLYPEDDGAHPDRWRLTAGIRRFAAASPCPRQPSHRAGVRITGHQRGFKQFTRPVFPQPVAARVERAALGLLPRASHPADQEPTTHAEMGTGHRARTWNYRSTHIPVDLQSGSSLNTCDLASHVAVALVRSAPSRALVPSSDRAAPSPGEAGVKAGDAALSQLRRSISDDDDRRRTRNHRRSRRRPRRHADRRRCGLSTMDGGRGRWRARRARSPAVGLP